MEPLEDLHILPPGRRGAPSDRELADHPVDVSAVTSQADGPVPASSSGDLLECAWPGVLEAVADPLESLTWRAALAVSVDPAVIAAMTGDQFLAALRERLVALGGKKVRHQIAAAVHGAAADLGGIAAERDTITERAGFTYQDWISALAALADAEARMLAVLDELGLTRLVTTIPGLSAVGAAVILAQRRSSPLRRPAGVGQTRRAGATG